MAPSCRRGPPRLEGRDLALIAAGLTFYAGIAVVPLLVLAFGLTARLTSPDRVTELGDRLAELLRPSWAPRTRSTRLVEAGIGLGRWTGCSPSCPMTLYGEGCGGPAAVRRPPRGA